MWSCGVCSRIGRVWGSRSELAHKLVPYIFVVEHIVGDPGDGLDGNTVELAQVQLGGGRVL